LGQEVENGELPNDIEWIGKVVKDICYYNAQQYFNWKELGIEAGVSR
jgi:glucuronate isomerase